MIPFIRSHLELMAITKGRDNKQIKSQYNELESSTIDSGQRKRYIRSIGGKEIDLPSLQKTSRRKWRKSKKVLSKFFDSIDYNNQIQSSYDITLLARENQINHKDAA